MCTAKRLLVAAVLGAAVSTSAVGQTTGGNTGGNANQGGSGGVTSNLNNESNFTDLVTIPAVTGITTSGRAAAGGVNSQNAYSTFFSNPQYMGMPGTTNGIGGFGTAMYSTTGAAGGRAGGTASVGTANGGRSTTGGAATGFISGTGNTGLTGATGFGGGGAAGGGFGATGRTAGGAGGFGGAGVGGRNTAGMNGQAAVISSPNRDIAYVSRIGSPGPAVGSPLTAGGVPAMQIELRTMFDNSPLVAGNKSIQVTATPAGLVTLTGTVASDDEKRMIEGMTKITAGVRKVDSKLVVGNGG